MAKYYVDQKYDKKTHIIINGNGDIWMTKKYTSDFYQFDCLEDVLRPRYAARLKSQLAEGYEDDKTYDRESIMLSEYECCRNFRTSLEHNRDAYLPCYHDGDAVNWTEIVRIMADYDADIILHDAAK